MPKTSDIAAAHGGPVDAAQMAKANAPVSSRSLWNSECWDLDLGKSGRTVGRINFGLVPARFQTVARVAAWSALVDPRGLVPPSISTVVNKMQRMDEVLAWIARCNSTLAEVDGELFEYFLDDLEDATDNGRLDSTFSGKPSKTKVLMLLNPWTLLRDQARAMADAGVDAVTFDPFEAQAAHSLAEEISGDGRHKVKPLPDEIAVPLVAAAARMAGTPTDEIADALAHHISLRLAYSGKRGLNHALPALEFSPLEDGGRPWLEGEEPTDWMSHSRIIWNGVRLVVGAHVMMIFACGVPRPGELLAARGGRDESTGLPTCIERSTSASQLFDHYWMLSMREKLTDDEPEDDDWLIGCAVAGDDQPPEGVEAVIGIQRILAPVRDLARGEASDRLLVSAGPGVLNVDGTRVSPMSYHVMREWMNHFVAGAIAWKALPDTARDGTDLRPYKKSFGRLVTARAWRKTLVQFMLRIDARMTLPLARRLRHKVHTVLNEAYQDTDPALMEEVDDAMARTLARTLVGVARGERKIVGWLGQLMEANLDEIRDLTRGLDGEKAVAKVQDWARERQLGLLEAGPGKCGLRLMPRHALCHQVAGTAGWWQKQPHPNRTDEHCANCKCCVVDSEHLHFWTGRYVSTRRQVLISRRLDREGEAWVHAEQAAIAKSRLTKLNAHIPADEEIHP